MKSTIYELLCRLSGQIRTAYPAFAVAYPYAKADMKRGLILSSDGSTYVAFSDVNGDYFYIRTGEDISMSASKQSSFSDCGAGLDEKYSCVLVAMMRNGFDPLKVKDALISEIMAAGYTVKKGSVDPVNIIRAELKGLNKNDIDIALSKFDPYIAVKIEFDVMRQFSISKCKIDLCKIC